MIEPLQTTLVVVSLLLALVVVGYVALDRSADTALVGALGLLEVALLVQAVIGIAQVATEDRSTDPVVFVGYLLGILLVLPAGVLWSLAERTRAGTAVLVVACLTVAFLMVRLGQIWQG